MGELTESHLATDQADADQQALREIEHGERRNKIWQLQQTLTGHDLIAELAESEPLLVVAGDSADGFRSVTVHCDRRASDGGALWFWCDRGQGTEGKPLAPVDRPVDAVTAILSERILRM